MKILLAPAETKNSGGEGKPYCKENFFLPQLFEKRDEIFNIYEKQLENSSLEELSKWFGLKKIDELEKYKQSLKDKPTMKAIQRYNGVAFDAIEYNLLKKEEKAYIDENVILFSNLFGPIKADDLIPDYKYKQGAKLPNIGVEKFFMDNFTSVLDEYIGDEIIDLRAGYYEKFYKVKDASFLTFKFIKEGKVVSHWAKHYRGTILKEMAVNNIRSIADFMNLPIENLKINEIKKQKNKTEIVYDII